MAEGEQYVSEQARCRSLLAMSEAVRMSEAAWEHHTRCKEKVPGGEPYVPDGGYACREAEGQNDLAAEEGDARALDAEDEVVAAVVVATMVQVEVAEGAGMGAVAAQLAPAAPGAPYLARAARCAAPRAPPLLQEGEVE